MMISEELIVTIETIEYYFKQLNRSKAVQHTIERKLRNKLQELKEALGDKILVDGIPAINFLPFVKKDELKTFVDNLLRIFSPNIIVGISDMLPPDGDIEKVRMISEMIKEHFP